MKPSVSVALIVCGAMIVIAPIVHAYFTARVVALVLITRTAPGDASINASLSEEYVVACFGLAAVMIAVAIVGAFKSRA